MAVPTAMIGIAMVSVIGMVATLVATWCNKRFCAKQSPAFHWEMFWVGSLAYRYHIVSHDYHLDECHCEEFKGSGPNVSFPRKDGCLQILPVSQVLYPHIAILFLRFCAIGSFRSISFHFFQYFCVGQMVHRLIIHTLIPTVYTCILFV